MSKPTVWQFSIPSTIKFGRGSRRQLADSLLRHRVTRPLVVTDGNVRAIPGVAEWIDGIRGPRQSSASVDSVTIFDRCFAEPTVEIAVEACELARASGADGVIGLGGGSNLDVAKIVALVGQHGGHPRDYFGFDRVPGPVLPMFAVPTTAGTGSEVSHSAVLTDKQQAIKISTLSNWLRPTTAFVDPELSDACPPRITAHSGIDALVHAIEAYTNRSFDELSDVDPQTRAYEGSYPLTKMLAAEAIRLIGRALLPACSPSPSARCRDEMAWAATLAGMAFSNSGVGIVHALEYPLGALTGVGHGEGNGLLLPHVMRYNLPVRYEEFADIARWLGADIVGRSLRDSAQGAVEQVESLVVAIGIRTRLSQLGVEREQLPSLAAKAFEIKRLMDLNPQPVTQADLEQILHHAY